MIRHIVLIRFQPVVTEPRIAKFFSEFHENMGKVPGVVAITSGKSESPKQIERG